MSNEQIELFPRTDPRPPITATWNLWHGCSKVSAGCTQCYMHRRDESVCKDPSIVRKTQSFNLPIRRLRSGQFKNLYKVPSGSHIFTCFSSDFFHSDADEWRPEAWDMMNGREYNIPREHQHERAHKAGLDFDGNSLLSMMNQIPSDD